MKRLALLLALCWPAVGAAQVTGGSGGVTYIPFPPPGMTYSSAADLSSTGGLFSTKALAPAGPNYTGPASAQNIFGMQATLTGGPVTNGPFNAMDFLLTSTNFQDTGANTLINALQLQHNFGGTSALGAFAGANLVLNSVGTTGNSGPSQGQYADLTLTGQLGWNDNGGALTFTAGPTNGSTSATLNTNWLNPTAGYPVVFSDGEVKVVTLTNSATTATWSGGLLNTVTTAARAYSGTLYGFNPNVRITCNSGISGTPPCGDYIYGLYGAEYDIAAYAGSTLARKIGLQIVQPSLDAVSASIENIGFSLNNGPSAQGWQMGYAIGSYDGNFPITSTGTLFGCWKHGSSFQLAGLGGTCGTAAYGLDLSGLGNGGYQVTCTSVCVATPSIEFAGNVNVATALTSGMGMIAPATNPVYTDTSGSGGTITNSYLFAFPTPQLETSVNTTYSFVGLLHLPTPTCNTGGGGTPTCSSIFSLMTDGPIRSGGLITSVAGVAVTGAGVNLNVSSNFNTNINTGTSNGAIHIGDGSGNNAIGIGNGTGVVTFASPNTFSNAAVKMTALATGTNADTVCYKADGTLLIQASTCTISSLRFKEHVLDFKRDALSLIDALGVKSFNMKPAPNPDPNYGARQVGLIAEDVARVMPECAIYENDLKTPKSYRQECVIAMLVKGEQELAAENRELRAAMLHLMNHEPQVLRASR